MGHEVDWVPGIAAVIVGLVIGIVAALRARKGPAGPSDDEHAGRTRAEARAIRIEDLRQRKVQLLQQIRDLEDTDLAEGLAAAAEEREALEQEAARVLRELHHLEGKQAGPKAEDGASTAEAAKPEPSKGGMSAELRGALTGGAVVGFAALLVFALQSGTAMRTGDMPMTGGDLPGQSEPVANLPPPGSGRPGEAVPGVPPSLQPKASPRVDAARAAVAADPSNVEARVELGWALIEAEGWIDVFNNAEQLRKVAPNNPDAYVQQAVVRVRMGQRTVAEELLDTALGIDPEHGRGLAWKGSLRWQAGDKEAAKDVWTKGQALHPDEGFTELLKMANGEITPTSIGAPPAGDPDAPTQTAETTRPAETTQPASAAKPAPITGTVLVPEGTQIPSTAVIFVYARPAGQTAGPPLAAVRLGPKVGAVPFSIGPDNMPPMMGRRPFPDSVSLAARLDLDGSAGTKDGPSGAVAEAVAAGSAGVTITLAP